MYYRYEIKNKEGIFVGLFCLLNPSQRRFFNRFVKEPSWYKHNPNTNSRCWFTKEGYKKYHNVIDKIIAELRNPEIRLLKVERLDNIVSKGKIQCIELITNTL